ncbi:hypothetical protein D3C73_1054690 [compost metagenome]
MADMQRTGRVGRHVLHAHRAAIAGQVAAVIGAFLDDGDGLTLVRGRRQVEIDETGAGDLDLADVFTARQRLDQRLCQCARIAARGFGQQHRGVGGEVAMVAGLRALDHEVRRQGVDGQGAIGAQGFDALADQGAEEIFHEACCENERRNRPF